MIQTSRLAFRLLWVGTTSSGLATWALPFALAFLVLENVLTAGNLGLVLALRTMGFLLGVPVGGVLADSGGRRKIVLWSSVLAALGVMTIIASLQIAGTAALLLMALGAVMAGMGQGACRPAYQALVPSVVAVERLQVANAAMSFSLRVSTLLGPSLATLVSTAFGTPAVLVAIVILWLVSAVLPPWPAELESAVTERKGRFLGDVIDGLAEARRHPWFLAGLAALTLIIATGYSVANIMVPVISQRAHGNSVLLVGTSTAYASGAMLAAVLLSRWKPNSRGWWALGGLAAYALVPLGLLFPQSVVLPILAFFVAGVGIEVFNIFWFTAVQSEISPDKLARVSSLDFLLSYGLAPIGLAAVEPLSQFIGVNPLMITTALVCVAAPACAALVCTSRTFSSADERHR